MTLANTAFMGLGKTKQIVLSDTLIKEYTLEEIKVIIAHELGHQHHNDIFRLFLVQAAALVAVFFLVAIIFEVALELLGFGAITDVAALPLLIFITGSLNLVLTPILYSYIRRRETAADGFALKLTGDKVSFLSMMTRIHDQNLAEVEPARWIERLFYDHPSYKSRVDYANSLTVTGNSGGW